MAILELARLIVDYLRGTSSRKRDELDRIANYVDACSGIVERLAVEEPPSLHATCEELSLMLRGLVEEDLFRRHLLSDERVALVCLLDLGGTYPRFMVELQAEDEDRRSAAWEAWTCVVEGRMLGLLSGDSTVREFLRMHLTVHEPLIQGEDIRSKWKREFEAQGSPRDQLFGIAARLRVAAARLRVSAS